jgi:hypothetical protein
MASRRPAALAGTYDDGVVADVRPRESHEVAQTQPGISREIDCIGQLNRASPFQGANIYFSPDDLA